MLSKKSMPEEEPNSELEISNSLLEGCEALAQGNKGSAFLPSIVSEAIEHELDLSFQIEEKGYKFVIENDSFNNDLKSEPLFEQEVRKRKHAPERILHIDTPKHIESSKRKKGVENYLSPCPLDADESLDLETNTLRNRKVANPLKPTIDEAAMENKKLVEISRNEKKEEKPFEAPRSIKEKERVSLGFPGFKTASGRDVFASEQAMAKARRSLDFLFPSSQPVPPPKPKILLPKEKEVEEGLSIFHQVKKQILPIVRNSEEFFFLFNTFQWAWISFFPLIQTLRKEGRDQIFEKIQSLVVNRSASQWKADHPSILRRIAEKDEVSGVYMKLLVVGEGKNTIRVTDGVCSAVVALDEHLRNISHKFAIGRVIQVVGAKFLLSKSMPIHEANQKNIPIIELAYNGVKPCTKGPLGRQNFLSYIRSLDSIKMRGGTIGCLHLKVSPVPHKVSYLLNLNNHKTIIEEERIEHTIHSVEKIIKGMNLDREEEEQVRRSVDLKKVIQYEVYSMYNQRNVRAFLSIWTSPDNFVLQGNSFLFFFLNISNRVSDSGFLYLTTTKYTLIKPCP
ncbi:hypothetical protein NEFER03_1059 [Nematocida sp. LUAm3]|nr:hypothetical protein NEFER03_1059 [Nematocida sp. LUAm3]KAI5175336.1 hypothetical protein NEFER02_1265 [Nematocida sp. LUAm2]KAI5177707.1 hypothetical protein NEFER01_0931 [Nematocida sp. LUAm1]